MRYYLRLSNLHQSTHLSSGQELCLALLQYEVSKSHRDVLCSQNRNGVIQTHHQTCNLDVQAVFLRWFFRLETLRMLQIKAEHAWFKKKKKADKRNITLKRTEVRFNGDFFFFFFPKVSCQENNTKQTNYNSNREMGKFSEFQILPTCPSFSVLAPALRWK